MGALLCEALYPRFNLNDQEKWLQLHMGPLMTDCKSAYDN